MAKKTNYLPWIIGGAAAWLLLRKQTTIQGIGAISKGLSDFANKYDVHIAEKKTLNGVYYSIYDDDKNLLAVIFSVLGYQKGDKHKWVVDYLYRTTDWTKETGFQNVKPLNDYFKNMTQVIKSLSDLKKVNTGYIYNR